MLKSTDKGLRAIPFPIDDPERIPVQRYFDEEFYQAELDHLWPHAWQMACRLEQIPEVGDWIEYVITSYSIHYTKLYEIIALPQASAGAAFQQAIWLG